MRFPKLILAFSALTWLAACTTVPHPPPAAEQAASPVTPPAETASVAVTPPSQALPATPSPAGLAAEPIDAPPDKPAINAPRPALLGGEPAREFERGGASWYGPGFQGRRTASGERYNMNGFTAAHRTLPFGTWVRVHSLVNGRQVDVRITDRGPFIRSRVIDVSRGAAEALGMMGLGFKEVVLLVPESTFTAVDEPLSPFVVKGQRSVGRVSRNPKSIPKIP